jgi:hypothetical protein
MAAVEMMEEMAAVEMMEEMAAVEMMEEMRVSRLLLNGNLRILLIITFPDILNG